MTLREQIKEINDKTGKLIDENPEMTSVWWEIIDADIEEMKQLETGLNKMDYCDSVERMRLNAYEMANKGAVIFIFSRPVKVKKSFEIIEIESVTV